MKTLDLTNEQYEQIESMASVLYTSDKMAIFLGVDVNEFVELANNNDSAIYRAIKRGQLMSEYDINLNSLVSAKAGNATQMQRLDKIRSLNEFEAHKRKVIYGDNRL